MLIEQIRKPWRHPINNYLGIDLGETNILAGVVNESGEIVVKQSTSTNSHRSADEIISDGIHINPPVIRFMFKLDSQKMILV